MYDRVVRLVAAALAAAAGVAVAAQPRPYPVYNEYHLDRTMKLVGRNFAGAREALDAGRHETAKAFFTRTREQIAVSITYWRNNGRDDAIGMLRDVLDGLDALDAALSRPRWTPRGSRPGGGRRHRLPDLPRRLPRAGPRDRGILGEPGSGVARPGLWTPAERHVEQALDDVLSRDMVAVCSSGSCWSLPLRRWSSRCCCKLANRE